MPLVKRAESPSPELLKQKTGLAEQKEVKLLLIGDSRTGKSAFVKRFSQGDSNFDTYEPTVVDSFEGFH